MTTTGRPRNVASRAHGADLREVVVQQRRGDRATHVRVGPQLQRRADADQDRQEVERGVAGGGPDRVGGARGADPAELDGQGQEGLDHARPDQRPQQRLEGPGEQVERPVRQGDVQGCLVHRRTVPRGRDQRPDLGVHQADVLPDDHLELPPTLHGAHDSRQGAHDVPVGGRAVSQDQAQPRRAMAHRPDVRRSTDAGDDPGGELVDVHHGAATSRWRNLLTCTIR